MSLTTFFLFCPFLDFCFFSSAPRASVHKHGVSKEKSGGSPKCTMTRMAAEGFRGPTRPDPIRKTRTEMCLILLERMSPFNEAVNFKLTFVDFLGKLAPGLTDATIVGFHPP